MLAPTTWMEVGALKRDLGLTHRHQWVRVVSVAREIVGAENVDDNRPPEMGAEDFSFMLEARPGAFLFLVVQLQTTLGYRPVRAGAALVPLYLIMLIGSPQSGRLADQIGARVPIVAGNLILAAGIWWLSQVGVGSDFLPDAIRKLGSTHNKLPGHFSEHPVDTLRRHWWINPFWEDDPHEVVELMGADRVIFGSDWPHIEGMPEPLHYLSELDDFAADERRRILLDNVAELNTPRPA